jgi:uroporphyrin-III C-methyltransferase
MSESQVPAVLAPAVAKRSYLGYWVLLLTFLVMLAATGVAVRNMKHQLKNEIKDLQAALEQNDKTQQERHDFLVEELANAKMRIDNNLNGHQSRLSEIDQRLQEHHKRLQSLTSRSLDDRLWAEALLLLKQANQRLLLERDIAGAVLLLTEAEKLLGASSLASSNADLLGLRQTLNRDLTALKLLKPVDKEGIYLQLNSLVELIPQLPNQPQFEAPANLPEEPLQTASWRDWVSESWRRFKQGMGNYIRLEDRSDLAKPIITQETAKLLQLNLRLELEQAQAALLQSHQLAYQRSLKSADTLLAEYFWEGDSQRQYRQTLAQLLEHDLEQALPSLSEGIQLLQAFSDRQAEQANLPAPSRPLSPVHSRSLRRDALDFAQRRLNGDFFPAHPIAAG